MEPRLVARPKRPRHDATQEAIDLTAKLASDDKDHGSSSTARFDPRNPAMLLDSNGGRAGDDLDARDEEDLEFDIGGATNKRNAVNIDGYESDSSGNEQMRKPKSAGDDEDMFGDEAEKTKDDDAKSKKKKVRLLDEDEIEGQDFSSKREYQDIVDEDVDEEEDDEEVIDFEEVGAAGRKQRPPKLEAFNMREDMEEGRFDESGNFIHNAPDPHASHDSWLQGVTNKDILKARESMERSKEAERQAEMESRGRSQQDDTNARVTALTGLIKELRPGECPLELLARINKERKTNGSKRIQGKGKQAVQDAVGSRIEAITEWTDLLLAQGNSNAYEDVRELYIRAYKKDTGSDWIEDEKKEGVQWEYKWPESDEIHSGFSTADMKAWTDAGYWGDDGVWVRHVGSTMDFVSSTSVF